jgi:RNA polymerase sigma-70 factor (ECF subfamily)
VRQGDGRTREFAGLVESALREDRDAFAALVEPYLARSIGAARLITSDETDAADAVQEALITAWRALPALRDPERFPAWFRQIVLHSALRIVRDRRRLIELDIEAPAPDDALDRELDHRRVGRALARLDSNDRVLLTLHYYWRLPVAETSGVLGIPEGTVRSRVHHALERLRAAYDAEERA